MPTEVWTDLQCCKSHSALPELAVCLTSDELHLQNSGTCATVARCKPIRYNLHHYQVYHERASEACRLHQAVSLLTHPKAFLFAVPHEGLQTARMLCSCFSSIFFVAYLFNSKEVPMADFG